VGPRDAQRVSAFDRSPQCHGTGLQVYQHEIPPRHLVGVSSSMLASVSRGACLPATSRRAPLLDTGSVTSGVYISNYVSGGQPMNSAPGRSPTSDLFKPLAARMQMPFSPAIPILLASLACTCVVSCTRDTSADQPEETLPTSLLASGRWGGVGIRLDVTEEGARLEYDCASGTIDEPLVVDADGFLEAHGVHVFDQAGPIQPGDPQPPQHPALYRGRVDGDRLSLTVTLLDTRRVVGTFDLGLGHPPELDKCL